MENLSEKGLVRALATGARLLYVVTENERYTEGIVAKAATAVNAAVTTSIWTCTDGFLRGDTAIPKTLDARAALDFALAQPGPALFLMKDLAAFWHDSPFIVRKLKAFAAGGGAKTLVVLGQDEKGLAALLALNEDELTRLAREHNVPLEEIAPGAGGAIQNPSILETVRREVNKLVSRETGFKPFERIAHVIPVRNTFAIGKELTQTLKVKRRYVEERYRELIQRIFPPRA